MSLKTSQRVSADLKRSCRVNAENKCSDLAGVTSGSRYVPSFEALSGCFYAETLTCENGTNKPKSQHFQRILLIIAFSRHGATHTRQEMSLQSLSKHP